MKVWILLILCLNLQALAQKPERALTLREKREVCYGLLVEEFKSVLSSDSSFVQAKLARTGIKLAKNILEKKGDIPPSLKSYADALVGGDLLERLERSPDVMQKVIALYESRGDKKEVFSPKLEVYADLQDIVSANRLTDSAASNLIAHLSATGADFSEEDVAIAWFVDRASQNFDGQESHYIEGIIQAILAKDGEKQERLIAKNLAKARLKITGGLARVKENIFEANRKYCVSDYKDPLNAQHRSVFQGCREVEEDIIDSAFMRGLSSILHSEEMAGFEMNIGLLPAEKRRLTSDQIRAVQDEINSDKYSSKERVIEYYKRGLYPDNGSCQTFTLVDKKKGQTSVYSVDGEEIFSTPSIKASPRKGKGQVVFNPDGELRKFENGSYTRTSSAGVFYTILDMPKEERKRRLYDEEFDDRVFVISPRNKTDEGYQYDDSTTIALHGVPINGWVDNAKERLESFEGENRALSTGCVNLEGYAYDLMNELSQNHCPVYIVPEDNKNYFYIKNREVTFSTSVPERKKGSEPARKCDGVVEVNSKGETVCDGDWTADEENVNRYYYSPLSKEIYHQGVVVAGNEKAARSLFNDRDRLINKVVAGNIDGEDFEDLTALAHGIASSVEDAELVFKDLYNSYYELKHYQFMNFEKMSVDEKRKTIIEYYLDPKGLKKSRQQRGKKLYYNEEKRPSAEKILEKAKQVRFVHEDA